MRHERTSKFDPLPTTKIVWLFASTYLLLCFRAVWSFLFRASNLWTPSLSLLLYSELSSLLRLLILSSNSLKTSIPHISNTWPTCLIRTIMSAPLDLHHASWINRERVGSLSHSFSNWNGLCSTLHLARLVYNRIDLWSNGAKPSFQVSNVGICQAMSKWISIQLTVPCPLSLVKMWPSIQYLLVHNPELLL